MSDNTHSMQTGPYTLGTKPIVLPQREHPAGLIQRLLHDRVAGFWMQDRLDEYCKTYRRLFYLEKLFADVNGDMACSRREESLQR